MVFQTAPPQPASNARITWSPVLVGGADASQNGLGLSMPASFTFRSAMRASHAQALAERALEICGDAGSRPLALGHRVDHLLPARHAIAAGEIARVRRLHGAL